MTPDVPDRLIARSRLDGSCRRWLGSHNSRGYGLISIGGRVYLVHRVAYELWVGPIPKGLTIDHVADRGCAHRDCFEPAHLEAVTNAENQARTAAARKTHCKHGHPLTPENTIIKRRPGGRTERNCRTCFNSQRRARTLSA